VNNPSLNQNTTKTYSLWASIVRIVATLLIFLFHYEGLYHHSLSPLDIAAITMFLLISGYLSGQSEGSVHTWLIKRLKQILIPYWPVIFLVLLINYFIQYKPTTASHNIMIFLGLSYFVEDPVYVISWFITLILIFYVDLYFFRLIKPFILKILFLTASYFVICGYLYVSVIYFLSFYIGYFLQYLNLFAFESVGIKRFGLENFNRGLYRIQSYCYAFFLIHGGVLLFIIKVCHVLEPYSLLTAFMPTVFITYFYKNFIDQIIKRISP